LFDELAATAVQDATGTFVVVSGVGHVILTQLFAAEAVCAVQLATGLVL
jgi:hypothetical protein